LNEKEHHLSEGAVMLAFAMYLMGTMPDLASVAIHPDGEHGKRFDIRAWLEAKGFKLSKPKGKTNYGGEYVSPDERTIVVHPASGLGDVVASHNGVRLVAECKGGIVNTTHAGQLSRLRQGLCEIVGLSLCSARDPKQRQFAVVPNTRVTHQLAMRMVVRARAAGVEIALVNDQGHIVLVQPNAATST
jgi:hypothetical protein